MPVACLDGWCHMNVRNVLTVRKGDIKLSEFGNETATATMKLGEKSIEALLKLLKFLMERNERAIASEIKKEQLKSLKDNKLKQEAIDYLDKKRGYARMSKLLKSGEKLLPLGVALSPEELKKFNHFAKLSGLEYSSISDKRIIEKLKHAREDMKELYAKGMKSASIGYVKESFDINNLSTEDKEKYETLTKQITDLEKQRLNRIIVVREKNLDLVKDITDRMNMDIKFEDIDKEINDIKSKGHLSKADEVLIKDLEKEKERLNNHQFDTFNKESDDVILAEFTGEKISEAVSFERALGCVTERKYSQEPCIVCERTNPSNYMEISSRQEISDEGNPYVNTEFKVYRDGTQQKCSEFSHGKFTHYSGKDGKNTSNFGDKHWINMKKEMKEKGGFSNDLHIFAHKEDYQRYVNDFEKAKEKITPREDVITYEADGSSFKDCMGIINRLQGQLSDHNIVLNDQREMCNAVNKNVIHYDKNMLDDERMAYVAGANIVRQLNNYETMNDIQSKLAYAESDKQTDLNVFVKHGSPESMLENHKVTQENYDIKINDLKQQLQCTLDREAELLKRQEQIESISIIKMVQQEQYESEMVEMQTRQAETNDHELKDSLHSKVEEMQTQSKEQWKNDISDNKSMRSLDTAKTTTVKTTEFTRE